MCPNQKFLSLTEVKYSQRVNFHARDTLGTLCIPARALSARLKSGQDQETSALSPSSTFSTFSSLVEIRTRNLRPPLLSVRDLRSADFFWWSNGWRQSSATRMVSILLLLPLLSLCACFRLPTIADEISEDSGGRRLAFCDSDCNQLFLWSCDASCDYPPPPPSPTPPVALCETAVDLVLVLDASSSMSGQEESVRQFAIGIVQQLDLRPDHSSVGLVEFSSSSATLAGLTRSRAPVEAAIETYATPNAYGQTDIAAGLQSASNLLSSSSASSLRVILVLTDGEQTLNGGYRAGAIHTCPWHRRLRCGLWHGQLGHTRWHRVATALAALVPGSRAR